VSELLQLGSGFNKYFLHDRFVFPVSY
jgi:hypothetical protein